jgi:large subunit ribosomal protein L16
MLQPKKTKFRKAHKGRVKGVATSATTLNFGTFGLKSLKQRELLQDRLKQRVLQ